MSIDPVSVKTFDLEDDGVENFSLREAKDGEWVSASDYATLLRLWREQNRLLEWLKNQVPAETFETLQIAAKAEINVAYECGDFL